MGTIDLSAIKAKYPMPANIREISGFGGSYEAACRNMFYAAIEVMERVNLDMAVLEKAGIETFDQFTSTPNGKEVEAAMLAACNGCSGAMFGASLSHAFGHRRLGHAAYISELQKTDADESSPAKAEG